MDIKKLIELLTKLSKKYPTAIIYPGHKDGSGINDDVYLIGEYVDAELCNHRCFCIGQSIEISNDPEDDGVINFDEIK